MTAKERQYGVLAGLVVILVVVLWWSTGGEDPTGSRRRPSNQQDRARANQAGPPVADVGLDRLSAERDALQPVERNPFRFRPRPAPPSLPPPQAVSRPQPVRQVAPAGPPPPPPAIPLRYIGFAEEASKGRVGVFSDGKGTVANGKEGDILEGRYRVLRLGDDSAELVYLDGRGRQTIPLRGQ